MVNFYLKEASAKKETLIIVSIGGRRPVKVSLEVKILPSLWDFKKQRTKRNAGINLFLDRVYKEVYRLRDEALASGGTVLYREGIKAFVAQHQIKPNAPVKVAPGFEKHWGEFVQSKKLMSAPSSIKKYNTVKSHLDEYFRQKHISPDYSKFTWKFFDDFSAYLLKDMINSTQGKYIKIIKTFLKWGIDRGYHKNGDYLKFSVKSYEADVVALTETELMAIYKKDLSTPGLSQARDLFCFACFTGLRYSDIENLKKENVKDGHLMIKTVKTKQNLKVPLNKYAVAILKKYNYRLPQLAGVKVNLYLKSVAKLCEINDKIVITRHQGSEVISETFSKHELITTHTGRRTFITLSLEKGIRPEVVMAITGHKNYNTFKKYIKLTDTVVQSEMNKAWN
jgi:integrase